MKTAFFIPLLFILGIPNSYSLAQTARAIPQSTAFVKVPANYKPVKKGVENVEIKNMPPIRNQGALPICDAMTAATIAQFYICKTQGKNCSSLPANQSISPLNMIGWGQSPDIVGYSSTDANNGQKIKFGGSPDSMLRTASIGFKFKPDSCYDLDAFEKKYADNEEGVKVLFDNLESYYKKNRVSLEAGYCAPCKSLGLKNFELPNLKEALGKQQYGEFLYQLYFNACKDEIVGGPKPIFNSFPSNGMTSATVEQTIEQMKKILNTGMPTALNGICLQKVKGVCRKDKEGKPLLHSVVISGYRKMCDSTGCIESVKVHNSWGDDWQSEYDNGWVDAKE